MSQTKVQLLDLNGLEAVLDADADTTITADTDDQIDFKAGGTDIMSLTATTATFNDGVTISVADNSDTLTLKSTDTDANSAPILNLFRDANSAADNDFVGSIKFNADNDANEETQYYEIKAGMNDASDGTEDGMVRHSIMVGGTLRDMMTLDSTIIVFNETQQNVDFRVESSANSSAFKIDAGNDVAGFNTTSSSYQLAVENQAASGGRFGIRVNNPSSTDTGNILRLTSVRSSSLASSRHIITTSDNDSDIEFSVRGDGNVTSDNGFDGTGADYAEYFEWKDGNSSDEDRVGYSVVLDENKIVKATNSDDASKIIGVISANPAIVGDSDIDRWKQKFLLDDFGREITEEITVTEWKGEYTEEDGTVSKNHIYSYDTDRIPSDVTVPSDAEVKSVDSNGVKLLRRKTNPDWNDSETYISREDRKEWDTVGLMGKLRLKKGQPTGTNWIKMRDISDTVEEWLVR